MGRPSTPSVGDGDVNAAIKRLVSQLRRKYRIERILLFGSRGRGDALKASDVDLVVVSPDFRGVNWRERTLAVSRLWRGPVRLEALCYTPEEFLKRAQELSIVRRAREEGLRLA
ncbi:MAG TPA: nucleotidyltransferase domain-containing protein [Thermoplasmata archaeon]|nr:nucleotidyltransferase domain-containing protein [Thermoplasmata archaeon]